MNKSRLKSEGATELQLKIAIGVCSYLPLDSLSSVLIKDNDLIVSDMNGWSFNLSSSIDKNISLCNNFKLLKSGDLKNTLTTIIREYNLSKIILN